VVTEQWGRSLIRAWNDHGWMGLPAKVGDTIGALIGAPPGTVLVGDTTSINIFKVLAAALQLRPGRKVLVSDAANFPTDLYMASGLTSLKGVDYAVRKVAMAELATALGTDVAAVFLTDIDYRSGRRLDMAAVTKTVQAAGALAIWDLSHSAGAMPTDLTAAGADLAVGCTYKYLNGGPGAPAFVYVAPRHLEAFAQPLTGWLGHAAPFNFEPDYRPAPGILRMMSGTPSVIGLSVLEAALAAFDGVDMEQVRAKSLGLADVFHDAIAGRCPGVERLTPTENAQRGSQLAYSFEHGYPVLRRLIEKGVIGDFRAPDIMRFGFAPLYLSYAEAARAGELLAETIAEEPWKKADYRLRKAVT
jgi:kynureninase